MTNPGDVALDVWEAHSEELRRRSLTVRHMVFCDGGLEDCHSQPGKPHDKYDRRKSTILFGASPGDVDIGTARLIRAPDVSGLPSGEVWYRRGQPLALKPHHSEPSRDGLLPNYRGAVGYPYLLRMVGMQVEASIREGPEDFLLTFRSDLFQAFPYLPWDISEPFDYPSTEGGPIPREPVWLATLNLHEMARATQLFNPRFYEFMFPNGTNSWLNRRIKREDEFEALAASNQKTIYRHLDLWDRGALELAELAPRAEAG